MEIWNLSINEEQLLNEVENIVSKGEIAYHKQFLILSQCFQSHMLQRLQKTSECGKGSRDKQNI